MKTASKTRIRSAILRNILLIAIASLSAGTRLSGQAPIFQWADGIGGNAADAGLGIAKDQANNICITGKFSGANVDFDPGVGTANLSSNGGSDIYVAKYG